MAKINLYVPDDLKVSMDRMGDSVNWSRIAQVAFSTAISAEEWKMQIDKIEAAVARLKATEVAALAQDELSGKTKGRKWAMERATLRNLIALTELFAYNRPVTLLDLDKINLCPNSDEFSEYNIKRPSDAFVSGFAEGAYDFYVEVQDKVK